MLVQHRLDLGRVDVFARGDDHVVLAAGDRDELVFVPGAHVARVQPALVELGFCHFLIVIVAECTLRGGGNDDLARGLAVARDGLVRLGVRSILPDGDQAHVVVRARATGRPCHFGQVERAQEGVPESLGRAVAVEDVGRQKLHVLLARGLFKRRAHGDDAAQCGQVGGRALLRAREHRNDGRHADQEGNLVLLRVFQGTLGREVAQDDHFAACVQRRAGAARVDAAAVEPRGHVHGAVQGPEREVHHHVMRGEHLVNIVDRHALGAVGGTRGIQPGGFIVDMRVEVDRGIGFGLHGNIVLIPCMSRRSFGAALVIDHDDGLRLVFAQMERAAGQFAELGVVDKRLGAAVVDHERDLARALPVIDRAGDCADLMRRQIAEYELRRVEQGKHHHVVFPYAIRAKRMRQAVCLGVQFLIGPAAAGKRVVQRGARAKTRYVAQETV